ncbi:MAG: hypothetical protein LM572_02845 [Ignisphaera sp.]|jgi:hypothetical protein|nr:hypothetical protein [Ignisphaera sp.]MCC6056102.1 hypothetical protein [Desulfurococcaceae archaeon]
MGEGDGTPSYVIAYSFANLMRSYSSEKEKTVAVLSSSPLPIAYTPSLHGE